MPRSSHAHVVTLTQVSPLSHSSYVRLVPYHGQVTKMTTTSITVTHLHSHGHGHYASSLSGFMTIFQMSLSPCRTVKIFNHLHRHHIICACVLFVLFPFCFLRLFYPTQSQLDVSLLRLYPLSVFLIRIYNDIQQLLFRLHYFFQRSTLFLPLVLFLFPIFSFFFVSVFTVFCCSPYALRRGPLFSSVFVVLFFSFLFFSCIFFLLCAKPNNVPLSSLFQASPFIAMVTRLYCTSPPPPTGTPHSRTVSTDDNCTI